MFLGLKRGLLLNKVIYDNFSPERLKAESPAFDRALMRVALDFTNKGDY
jgi:hypothetical protein|tara:strand:+ start:21 stop:167 length:147 start_codon:yes stop_codon:yes gene_type:complete